MKKAPLPSAAQAKFLARVWALDNSTVSVMTKSVRGYPYNDATKLACVRRGWIAPTGEIKSFSDETEWMQHKITDAGTDAIENYFRETRYKRTMASAA